MSEREGDKPPERVRSPGGVTPLPRPADAFGGDDDPTTGTRPPARPATPLTTRYDVGEGGGAQPPERGSDEG